MVDQAILPQLQRIHGLLGRGDVAAAAAAIAPLLASRRPEVHHLNGLVRQRAGDLAGAHESLNRAVGLGGGAEARNSLGNVLEDLGAPDEAERQFAAAAEQRPDFLPAWINRGRLASRRGDHGLAIRCLEQARRIDPRSSLALATLGNAYRRAGEPDKAVAALREAVALDPRKAVNRLHLASALRAGDRAAEAVAEYDGLERGGFVSPELLENRAAAWLDLDEVERARADVDRLVTQFPAHLEGHRARARIYWEWGLEGDPFEGYRRVSELHPREPAIWTAWLEALLSFRQYEAAAETARRAESALGREPGILAARAIAESELGLIAEADAAFEPVVAVFGSDPRILNAHARHLLRARRAEQAVAQAERALALDPDNQVSWAYLGTAWRLLGDPREDWLHDYEAHVALLPAIPPDTGQDAEAFANEAAETLRALHKTRVHPADQTLRHGTQTPGALFDRREPAVARIRAAVVAAAQQFIATLGDDPSHPLLRRKTMEIGFSGSWSVRLTRQGFHINHVHERGWLSSAYYFALPPRASGDQAEAGWLQLGAPPDELGLDLPPRRLIEPKVGMLALFPSSMWHGTVPFATEGERLTAAFDIVPASIR